MSYLDYLLQWGRPFYGAERRSTLRPNHLQLPQSRFNGAALFTGRRVGACFG